MTTRRLLASPALSAVRDACETQHEHLAGLAPVFERIGRQIDMTLSEPSAEIFLPANAGRLIVAVSDAVWRGPTLITDYGTDEIALLLAKTNNVLSDLADACGDQFGSEALANGFGGVWAKWSRHARKSFRRGVPAWNALADASIGSILLTSPEYRRQFERITAGGDIPVLAVAINSVGTTPRRLKCAVRAVFFSLPAWMRASGAVAGRA
jgi:hypothetical protein